MAYSLGEQAPKLPHPGILELEVSPKNQMALKKTLAIIRLQAQGAHHSQIAHH